MSQKYLGVKLIEAEPMKESDYLSEKSGVETRPQNGEDREGYKVIYPDGYVSWSPKKVFEKAYRPTTGLNFGLAIEAMKKGFKVTRQGWNGSGMFAYYVPSATYESTTDIAKSTFGSYTPYRAYLALKTAQQDIATWSPSTSDALAEDWQIVE